MLVAPGTALTGIAAKLIHLLAWKGKVFDATGASSQRACS